MAVLGYLPKLKRGLGLGLRFCIIFQYKCSLFNTLSIDKVSISYLYSFTRYQTKCVIKFLFRQLMTSQTLRFIFDQPLKQWLTGRKRWADRNTKSEYLQNKKSFLDEIKNIFHKFWRAIIWWDRNLTKKVDTSFKSNNLTISWRWPLSYSFLI